VAASSASLVARLLHAAAGLLSLLGFGTAKAATLPPDRAEALYHHYTGGGVTANGPALLVRKSLADKVSLSGSLYVDAVSNASVDVVTTASPYKERRNEFGLAADYAVRDALMGQPAGDRDWVVVGSSPQEMVAAGFRPVKRNALHLVLIYSQ